MHRRTKRVASSGAATNERGATALEFALVTPVLLMILIGIAAMGHAMMVRFMLDGAAYDAARICALARKPTSACTTGIVKKKLGNTLKWCTSWKTIPKWQKEPGFTEVTSLEVRVECVYGGIIGNKSYNQSHGIKLATLRARATMPF